MRPDSLKLLWDAREAAQRLQSFVAGKTLAGYLEDAMLRSATERQLEIIGEALNQLTKADETVAARIPELARIVALRNTLIHGYAAVDSSLIWSIVESKLPVLLSVLDDLLRNDPSIP